MINLKQRNKALFESLIEINNLLLKYLEEREFSERAKSQSPDQVKSKDSHLVMARKIIYDLTNGKSE